MFGCVFGVTSGATEPIFNNLNDSRSRYCQLIYEKAIFPGEVDCRREGGAIMYRIFQWCIQSNT